MRISARVAAALGACRLALYDEICIEESYGPRDTLLTEDRYECHEGVNANGPDELEAFLGERGFAVTRFAALDVEGGHLHAERVR